MKILMIVLVSLITQACSSTKELAAPCTYVDRSGCGELVYTHLGVED